MRRRTTLADIAERAGLSTSAVSMILNDRPGSRLSANTAERVRAIAEELRYRPNHAARSLRVGRTATVGFLSDDVTVTRFASAMIRGLLDVADRRDHTVLIAETGRSQHRIDEAVHAMLDRGVDGIVLGSLEARRVEMPELPKDVPAVAINCVNDSAVAEVLPEEFAAGAAVTRHLLEAAGPERIALVGWSDAMQAADSENVSVPLRFDGIRHALRTAGVDFVAQIEQRSWEPDLAHANTVALLDDGPGVDAIICMNDRIAFGVYQALQERGVRVPHDVSIVSFDDDEIAAYLRPGLTTARLPYLEMGRRAMELVLDGDRAAGGAHRIPMPLQVRESVARRMSE